MRTFLSSDEFTISKPKLRCYCINLDKPINEEDVKELIGSYVAVDGNIVRCVAVEHFATLPPWYEISICENTE